MSDPGADMGARIDQWTAAARAKAERYQAMQARAGQVSVTETSRDGLVTITVDSAGNVTDLRITDRVREMSGERVAAAVLLTLRTAQSRLPEKLAEVMEDTIGDDQQTVNTIVDRYRAKFPEPEEDEEPERRIGDEVDDGTPRPAPRRERAGDDGASPPAPRRERAADDDEDFDDESFLNE